MCFMEPSPSSVWLPLYEISLSLCLSLSLSVWLTHSHTRTSDHLSALWPQAGWSDANRARLSGMSQCASAFWFAPFQRYFCPKHHSSLLQPCTAAWQQPGRLARAQHLAQWSCPNETEVTLEMKWGYTKRCAVSVKAVALPSDKTASINPGQRTTVAFELNYVVWPVFQITE